MEIDIKGETVIKVKNELLLAFADRATSGFVPDLPEDEDGNEVVIKDEQLLAQKLEFAKHKILTETIERTLALVRDDIRRTKQQEEDYEINQLRPVVEQGITTE